MKTHTINGVEWTQAAYRGPVTSPSGLRQIVPACGSGGTEYRGRYRHSVGGEWITPEPYGWHETAAAAAEALNQYAKGCKA